MSSPDEVSAPEVSGDKDVPSTGDMNSQDMASAPEADLGQEGREHLGDTLINPRVPEGESLVQRPLEIREGEGGLPRIESCELKSGPKFEAREVEEGVLTDPAGPTSSPVGQEEGGEVSGYFLPQLSIEAMTIMRELTDLQARKFCRYPSPQSCAAELTALWSSIGEGSNRGAEPVSSGEGKQVSTGSLYPRGLGRSRAWVTSRRGTTSKMVRSEAVQRSTSKPASDESSDSQTMKVTICLKEGNQAKSSGRTELEDSGKHTNVQGRGRFVHVPPSVLSSATRRFSAGLEKPVSGEPEGSLCKKRQSMVWGKEGSRPGYPGASAASVSTAAANSAAAPAPVASGALPKTNTRKKTAQEKKSLSDASRGPLGRTFPPWGQRLKSAPVEPATLPPISGVALIGKTSKNSLPSGPKDCKPFCTGKRSMARKTKESQPGAKEDDDQTRNPGLQAQLPTHRAEQPSTCTNHREMTSGDANFRAPQVPGNSQLLTLSQRSSRSRGPAQAGEQELFIRFPFPVGERQYQAPETMGCQQCLMLQKEIEELKEQLAIMQALNEKFQDL
ncbi:uncharacterized protein CXorf49 homolog isoform X1 [Cricetulus griseus]|uniref:uncharacterized protein CXorf49 homolog isoform X1 n=1 Tax=Cricetulus griseus TaxID=10029 RepID=UPI0015C2E7F9|nr:uncharacterized protein CXorf49 homolog isoform X1 [Cricetulus griseus]